MNVLDTELRVVTANLYDWNFAHRNVWLAGNLKHNHVYRRWRRLEWLGGEKQYNSIARSKHILVCITCYEE